VRVKDHGMAEWMIPSWKEGWRRSWKIWENELSPNNMYACPQIDTCHVGSYFGPLVSNFGTYDKIIIHTL
jgi:hypothetical protein